jgi:hypothetical protein
MAYVALSFFIRLMVVPVFFLQIRMTFKADSRKIRLQQIVYIRGMRVMAFHTFPAAHRFMHYTGRKGFFLICMAGKTETLGLFPQQPFLGRNMRIMT